MTTLTPGHWHRFHQGEPNDLVQWECPVCHQMTNMPTRMIRPDGRFHHPARHSACGFFDTIRLEGWSA
jgi:hypothetical protein